MRRKTKIVFKMADEQDTLLTTLRTTAKDDRDLSDDVERVRRHRIEHAAGGDDNNDDDGVPPRIGARRMTANARALDAHRATLKSYAVMTGKQTWKQITGNVGTCCVGFWCVGRLVSGFC